MISLAVRHAIELGIKAPCLAFRGIVLSLAPIKQRQWSLWVGASPGSGYNQWDFRSMASVD